MTTDVAETRTNNMLTGEDLSITVNITVAEGEQKMTDSTTFLSLSDVTQRFSSLPFLLKGSNSRVAQITTLHWRHRRKARRESKRR